MIETGESDRLASLTIAAQKNKWRAQVTTVPDIPGPKSQRLALTRNLLGAIEAGQSYDLDQPAVVSGTVSPRTWREYSQPLKTLGLIVNNRGILSLTREGAAFSENGDPVILANLLADRVRLFAELLGMLIREPLTVQEIHNRLLETYPLTWKTENNVRARLSWLEVLGLIEWLGDRKHGATELGQAIFRGWTTVSPESLRALEEAETVELLPAPPDIQILLDELQDSEALHSSRNTYNIWVPSPKSDPNKIENVRVSVSSAVNPTSKKELLEFIATRFNNKLSSVESMLPFLRAGGLLQEVQRGVFTVTDAAKAWLESGNEIDFIRIIHTHMRFIGELLSFTAESTSRADVYAEAARYGQNQTRARWIIILLLDAGLLVETSFSSVQATPVGLKLADSLPLAPSPEVAVELGDRKNEVALGLGSRSLLPEKASAAIASSLMRTSRDPAADGKNPGVAFEESIRDAFGEMGFAARRISGPGDTDVLVKWIGWDGVTKTAIIDGKATSAGRVTHNQVSDIALDTHRDKNSADYVAVVGAEFSGDTIVSMAKKRGWLLLTAGELVEILESSERLGLLPSEIGLIFDPAEGPSSLAEIIETRERELQIISLVVSRLRKEVESDEPLSPRDISLIERQSGLNPTLAEVREAFECFERLDLGIVRSVEVSSDPRYSTFEIGEPLSAARRLRVLADAIEQGLSDA